MAVRGRGRIGSISVLLALGMISAAVPVHAVQGDDTTMVPAFEGQDRQVPTYTLTGDDDVHLVTYYECPIGVLPTIHGPQGCDKVPAGKLRVRFEKLQGDGRVGSVRPRSGANPVRFRARSPGKGVLIAEYEKNRRRSFTNRNEVIVEAVPPPAVVDPGGGPADPDSGGQADDERWALRRVDPTDDPFRGRVRSPMVFRLERCTTATDGSSESCVAERGTVRATSGEAVVIGDAADVWAGGTGETLVIPARAGSIALEAEVDGVPVAGTTASIDAASDVSIVFVPPILTSGPDVGATISQCRSPQDVPDDGFPIPLLDGVADDPWAAGVDCRPLDASEVTIATFGDVRGAVVSPGQWELQDGASGWGIAVTAEADGFFLIAPEAASLTCPDDGLPADVNGDGVVDFGDVRVLRAEWGMATTSRADINRDGIVNTTDLSILSIAFGQTCPPRGGG